MYRSRLIALPFEVARRHVRLPHLQVFLALLLLAVPAIALADNTDSTGTSRQVSVVGSTVPANGDVNPYGEILVPMTVGSLSQGSFLISNFNSSANLQGTGTTLVQITTGGSASTFATIDPLSLPGACPGGVGLTGAVAVLQRGWVIVGSLPTTDGTSATAQAGCLIVLDSSGAVVETFAGPNVNGPWGMTSTDNGSTASLFVSNVLNGTVAANGQIVHQGTIVRFDLSVPSQGAGLPSISATTIVGSRFAERSDPAALVIGPQGLALSGSTLYVADSLNNRIASIANATLRSTSAGSGTTVSAGGALNDPLGVIVGAQGEILATNGNNGGAVTITPGGAQVGFHVLDNSGSPPGAGCLFDLVTGSSNGGIYYVDDCSNTLNLLH